MKFKMAAAAILNLQFLSIFGQMVYFRWQPSTSLQNFIHLRQMAAELLMLCKNPRSQLSPSWIIIL